MLIQLAGLPDLVFAYMYGFFCVLAGCLLYRLFLWECALAICRQEQLCAGIVEGDILLLPLLVQLLLFAFKAEQRMIR